MLSVRRVVRWGVLAVCGVVCSAGCDGGVVVDDGGVHFDAGIDRDDAGSDVDAGEAEDDAGTNVPACTRDAASMTAFLRCDSDDQCPCGTGCNLGRCVAECHDDLGDGQGEVNCPVPTRCDAFGRCRAQQDDTSTNAVRARAAVPTLRATPRVVVDDTGVATRSITLTVIDAQNPRIDGVRVEASDGLTVNCRLEDFRTEVPDFGMDAGPVSETSCIIPVVSGMWTIDVTGTRAFTEGEVRTVTLYAPGQTESITVVPREQLLPTSPAVLPPVFSTAGVYEGTVALSGVGTRIAPDYHAGFPGPYLGDRNPYGGDVPAVDVRAPVRMELFEVTPFALYRFRITDPMQVLSENGVLEGDFEWDGGGWALQIDRHPYVARTPLTTASPVFASTPISDVHARYLYQFLDDTGTFYSGIHWQHLSNAELLFQQALAFDLLVTYDLVPRHQRNPGARFSFRLTRTADLPASASLPAFGAGDVNPSLSVMDMKNVSQPTPWEHALWQQVNTDEDARLLAAAYAGQGAHLAMCVPPRAPYQDIGFAYRVANWWYAAGWFGSESSDIFGSDTFQIVDTEPGDSRFLAPFLQRAEVELRADLGASAPATGVFVNTIVRGVSPFLQSVDSPLTPDNPDGAYRELPCSIAYDAFTIAGPSVVTVPAFEEERCGELQARLACTPRTLDAAEQSNNTIEHTFPSTVAFDYPGIERQFYTSPGTLNGVVTRVCSIIGAPPACAEAAACAEPDDAGAADGLVDAFSSASGDAFCASSPRSFSVDADDNALGLTSGQMWNACLQDLATLPASPAPGAGLAALLGSHGCIDMGRFLLGLGGASDQLRALELDPNAPVDARTAAQRAHRLLTRFVELQAYVARETLQTQALAQILRRNPVDGAAIPTAPEDALAASLRGWSLLLDPRFATAVDRMPGAVLAAPDYRTGLLADGGTLPSNVPQAPRDPLATAVLRTLSTQVTLAERVIEDAQRSRKTDAARWTGDVLRHTVVLTSFASDLLRRAQDACVFDAGETNLCADGAQPNWQPSYDAAALELRAGIARLLSRTDDLLRGTNPLGVEEADLPLYFFGGQVADDSRFFAISDYLVGRSAGSADSWAPSLIADAAHKVDAARAAWLERQDRVVANESTAQARDIRVQEANSAAGARILELCGRPANLASDDVLTGWEAAHGGPFNANDCFIDYSNPQCQAFDTYLAAVDSDEARFAVCLQQEVKKASGGGARFADADVTAFAAACDPAQVLLDKDCATSSTFACLSCSSGATADVDAPAGPFLDVIVDDGVPAAAIATATQTCQARFTAAQVPLPGASSMLGDLPPVCFEGTIGEQALALRSVAKEIEIARTELSELNEAYDIAMKSCILRRSASSAQADMLQQHNKQMETLRTVKLAADIAANVAGGVKDCADSVAGATAPWDKAAAGVACGAAAVEAAAESVSDGMQFAMDNAEAAFELKIQRAEAQAAFEVCQNDSRQNLVGSRSQALRIQRALADLDTANAAFLGAKAAADLAYDEGRASVAQEEGRTLHPLHEDTWLDEKVSSFVASWRLAYRVTYLSVRAVEYEFQQSLTLRDAALRAEIPADLENVLRELRTYTGPRSIAGSRPTNRKVILSLRDQLLALGDQRDFPDSDQQLSPAERLRMRLTAERYAVYDANGTWLGQRVPFTVSPLGYVNDDDRAFEIYSQDACAERLWSVNASILGDDGLLRGSDTTFTNLSVLKANTFFSQWCNANDREAPYQFASVRPERNLFRDPEGSSAGFVDVQLGALVGQNESRALIQPAINVPRATFEDDAYENGDSSQLGARGLYGEYALFFPAQVLSRFVDDNGTGVGDRTDGLDLAHVDDILVRFDYVAAAR